VVASEKKLGAASMSEMRARK
jgi:hypothetical protein